MRDCDTRPHLPSRELGMNGSPYVFPHNENDFDHVGAAEARKWILKYAKHGGVGAELGVFRGHFSNVIMRDVQPSKLYLVDPWTKFCEYYNWGKAEETPYTNFNKLTTLEARTDAEHRLKMYGDAAVFVEDFEENFCRSFNGKLDFIYLDSSHFYLPTLLTLARLDSILADDGVILGDDWYTDPGHYSGVLRAANDFIRLFNYEIVEAGLVGQYALRRTARYTNPFQPAHSPSLAEILLALK